MYALAATMTLGLGCGGNDEASRATGHGSASNAGEAGNGGSNSGGSGSHASIGGYAGVGGGGGTGAGAAGNGGSGSAGSSAGAGGQGAIGGEPPAPTSVEVRLVPQAGVSGTERVAFAVPFARGVLRDENLVRVLHSGSEIGAALRANARHADGSVRSLGVQVDLAVSAPTSVQVQVGEQPAAAALAYASVESTLADASGTQGPRVWALLDATWLSSSGVAGPMLPDSEAGALADAWNGVCDYSAHGVDAFLPKMSDATVWLYDRGTVFYRGYARRGDLTTLETAYRETAIYRNGLTGSGAQTAIGVPGKASDLKYHYAQNLALHYLLTGDERFRESAENVADKVYALWPDPGYAGGADFWTERHAGFALLAYVWAEIVSDDRSAVFATRADQAVDAYVSVQDSFPAGYADASARCFAHTGGAAGEPYANFGCSPWMSAILADALDAYAAERTGERAERARQAVVKLGRMLAKAGRDAAGRPFYWMGVNGAASEADSYEEHWGESAYVIAMAYDFDGRRDPQLLAAANTLVDGLSTHGVAPHLRSMNWQCRSAVAAPFFLAP